VDGEAGVLIWIYSALCGDKTPPPKSLTRQDVAALEDCNRVAENKVHAAVDIAFSVKLALGICVKRVLVTFNAASV
jgi:hypothetical protein